MSDLMNFAPRHTGWIECIVGCMYAGKSSALISRLETAQYAKQRVAAFKPASDVRYSSDHLATHKGALFPVITGLETDPKSVLRYVVDNDLQVIGIDEIQFWPAEIVSVCSEVSSLGVRVIVAGLDLDYRGEPFGPIPEILSLAEFVTKLHAVCVVCGDVATRTQKISGGVVTVDVGATDKYDARCRRHWTPKVVECH